MDPQPPPGSNPFQPSQGAKQQIAAQLKNVTNVLVTVSNNPSVDQLAAAIGTTLVLNKMGKHATAVFSGEVPSTIEFLKPEKTLEKTTDSLRDFIIALDKSKADKLRYKVEDKYVRIYITPYHSSLSEKDLEFSQGDYNVELVLALGVKKQQDLDKAITSHGKILHDAAIISINAGQASELGSINLNVADASSLSEVMVDMVDVIKESGSQIMDEQIATAFLTGIVAETDRFSNNKTAPRTMNVASTLMKAGANQQLIANKLESPEAEPPKSEPPKSSKPSAPPKAPVSPKSPVEPKPPLKQPEPPKPTPKPVEPQDSSLSAPHESQLEVKLPDLDQEEPEDQLDNIDKIHIDDEGTLKRIAEAEAAKAEEQAREAEEKASEQLEDADARKFVSAPPSLGGRLSANTEPPALEPTSDPLSQVTKSEPLLDPKLKAAPIIPLSPNKLPKPVDRLGNTLTDLEDKIKSPHVEDKAKGLKVDYPPSLVKQDDDLPPDTTAGDSGEPKAPPIPPPLPM